MAWRKVRKYLCPMYNGEMYRIFIVQCSGLLNVYTLEWISLYRHEYTVEKKRRMQMTD
jgi:hypothetical protein